MKSRFRRVFVGLSMVVVATTVAVAIGRVWFAQAAPALQTLAHSVPAAVKAATPIGTVPQQQALTLTMTLQPRNKALLERYVQAIATPGSPDYHHFTTPAGFIQAFGPDANTLHQVMSFMQGAGLRVTKVQSGGLFISASGTVKQVEAAFHTQMKTYRDSHGHTFFANAGNLTLPATIAPAIAGVTGLDNATIHHRMTTTPRVASHALVKRPHDVTCPATTGQDTLTPPQLMTAYGFPTTLTGTGQNIAMVEFDGYDASDISAYAACFAPSANVNTVVGTRLVDLASPLTPGDGAIEDELDIEIALGMAPGLSKIHVYEAPNTNQGLIDMLAAIASDDLDGTVSDSWGSCESDTGFTLAVSEEVAFLQMAAQGQGVYVAAGDNGAYDCLNDLSSNPYFHGQTVMADDPATDPYVAAVGGTTLTINASTSSYMTETVWNNSTLPSPQLGGTGGGFSEFWATPAWQLSAKASTTPGGIADPSGARIIPDISADADPQTGYAEYCTVGSICQTVAGWFDVGGTSAATPLWAALAALAAQGSAMRVGLITPALYALYGADTAAHSAAGITINSTTYYDYAAQENGATPGSGTIVLNDITSGNNTFPSGQGFPAGYSAQTGYDAASGLGSMAAQNVVNYLTHALRFTTPRLYLAAQGNDQHYWLSGYFLNNGSNNLVPDATTGSGWFSLGSQSFQGPPAIVDNGITTVGLTGNTALLWVAGIDSGGTVQIGAWNPSTASFGGWNAAPSGTTCKGNPALAYAQNKLFILCDTTAGMLMLLSYTPAGATWGSWTTVGGGLTSSPTMATDGTTLLFYAQTSQNDWYNTYTVSGGTLGIWRHMATTCEATPAVAYTGTSATYALSCIANDTSTMWANTFDATAGHLSGWVNLGEPSSKVGFHNATAVSVDLLDTPAVTLYAGEGTNNAAYVQLVTDNPNYFYVAGWQNISLPGIFATSAATDYFGA